MRCRPTATVCRDRVAYDRGRAFLAVLIADAVAVALAAPTIPDIGSLYITVT